ncbi:MAG TPA: ATP-dependent protease ATPase subunit HslU [Leptospiraceae bacterium]|nr:ATP-dependent protease ATPase subunit HslU [Leptospiraceae bacterium]HRG73966.1 ATP-dependent protease ATPase subunit HslU [Leptospiraceae bacterium]
MSEITKPVITYEGETFEMSPREIVQSLDEHIIGQKNAKKAVAIALRNRMRRRKLDTSMREEIYPKNIIMIGPTGVGKTEIARRLSKLYGAPFIKVEATKYTEIGYVGRDVESMVRDLANISLNMVKTELRGKLVDHARMNAEEVILDILIPDNAKQSSMGYMSEVNPDDPGEQERRERYLETREMMRKKLKAGKLNEQEIELDISQSPAGGMPMMQVFGAANLEEMDNQIQNLLGDLVSKKNKKRKVPIKEAIEILADIEADKLLDQEKLQKEAARRVEEMGIIFIDEIDKIAGKESRGGGADVSREGVQRDLLPIVEGATVNTKIGPIKTDHILFIAAGAFHMSKPSDLIPELQGRFPIRVELDKLSMDDFVKILTAPKSSLTKQYQALLSTEGISLEFKEDAIKEIALIAFEVNEKNENIGARRLNTILERLLEDISFEGPELVEKNQVIDANFVRNKLNEIVENRDLSKYIL